jgi:tRNA dimethylallyltransferase
LERALKLPDREPLLVVVLGPTASGKTALSLAIARRFPSEIVNCDSVAMYREFEIGTAKPSAAERAEIPHHLVDCVDPLADVSAGEYARQARQVLREIGQRRHLPIVSGGTGLYLRALLEGLFSGPQRSGDLPYGDLRNEDLLNKVRARAEKQGAEHLQPILRQLLRNEELRSKLRARAKKHGTEHLHRILRRLDPLAASRIHPHDVPKVIRAIEVCLASRPPFRRTMTELWQQGREPLHGFRILRLGLNPEREALYARINQRAAQMFDEGRIDGGLIAETEMLLPKYGERARPLASLGYKQALQFLRGELDRESALAAAQQAHRNYAKRQITWFRREPDVHWLAGFGDDPAIQGESIATVEREI